MPHSLSLFGASDGSITAPVAISACALLFTVASFWWIQARRGVLRVYTGHVLSGALAKKTILYLPFVFYNPAPSTLTVVDLRLIIEGGSARPDDAERLVSPGKLFWIASHDAVYPESGKHRQYAMPFAVEGRRAIGRVIEFQWEGQRSELKHGPYTATLEGLVLPQRFGRRRWHPLLTIPLNTQLWTAGTTRILPRSNDPEYHAAIEAETS
ncbi:hypothetical protein AB0C06_27275 [Micromonospora inaquosa]|uniref:hypothetical protein n=1 Tax=Micromonospora inaquosa TaxID=2203716 RepID=UPI00340CA6EE